MMLPARTKKGTASRLKLSMPVASFCPAVIATTFIGITDSIMHIEEHAIAIAIGKPQAINMPNVIKR